MKINDKLSSLRPVKYGVPQGSVLEPLLFLLHVNDLPNVYKYETTLFADDTTLHLFFFFIIIIGMFILLSRESDEALYELA